MSTARAYRVMGVLNVTPDSFSDGGRFLAPEDALAHASRLAGEGADIIDIGGESTRPGAEPVSADEELARVQPVLERLADERLENDPQISIDTCKSAVASAAVAAGASFVNDVSALRGDPEMAGVIAQADVECSLMHMLGEPRTMQQHPQYEDVVDDVRAFLEERLAYAVREGVREERIVLDPGIGFGKSAAHNLALLARLDELCAIGRPLLIGTSRKSFIGRLIAEAAGRSEPVPAAARLPGTIATNVLAFERGARVFRVHDVAAMHGALALAAATLGGRWTERGTQTT